MRDPIAIIARVLPNRPDIVAVRWTVDARAGFPHQGFELARITNAGTTALGAALRLPGAVQLAGGAWTIDETGLLADLAGRTGPGVPMPDAAMALALKPLLTFALPGPDADVLQAMLEAVALCCLDAHRESADLARDFWQYRTMIPATADIAAMRGSARSDDARLYDAVIYFYRHEAVSRLLAIASDFGMAKLLGLGLNDALPTAARAWIEYEVHGDRPAQARAPAMQPNQPWPPPPTLPELSSADGVVGYPPFEPFFGTRLPRWAPLLPPPRSPNQAMFRKLAAAASQGPRRWDSPIARLRWTTEPVNDEGISPDLPNLAVHWQVERFVHSAGSVGEEVEPHRDPRAIFTLCHDGGQVPARPVTEFSDDPAMPWGALPMEGWYAYRVRGVDLFGIAGVPSAVAPIRLLDTYAPSAPAVRLDLERLEIPDGGRARLGCTIDWQAINEFQAPDARVFRIYQRWTPVEHVGLRISSAAPAAGELGILLADAVVEDEAGRPLDAAALAALAGASLRASNADFRIRGAGALASSLRVERSTGRIPEPGGASALRAGAPIDGPMREVTRQPAQAGALIVADWVTLAFAIATPDPGSPGRVVPAKGKLYLHVLGTMFDVMPSADGTHFLLQPPNPRDQPAAAEIFDALMRLPVSDRTGFVGGSPALFLPSHEIALDLAPPGAGTLLAGTLRIAVSAADAAPYRHGRGGPGNEGPCTEEIIPVRVARGPSPPPWRPRKLWADDAASFATQSAIRLRWPAILLAASYQVERAFENALRRPASASDDDLLAHAATTAADPAFERVTERAFAPGWVDTLPGTAPARIVYRVRGVSVAGKMSDWVVVALVRVPDTRIPPSPNFLFARPPANGAERAIACCWTQAGPLTGIGFVIEARDDGPWTDDVSGWRDVAELLPEAAVPGPGGRFTLDLAGQRPGCRQQLRLRAIRHALDPDDPLAQRARRIRGPASARLMAHATGTIIAPSDVSLSINDADGTAILRWTSNDRYRGLEVHRRGPGRFGFERVPIAADATEHVDAPLPEPGRWTYRLAAIGWTSRDVSNEVSDEWDAS